MSKYRYTNIGEQKVWVVNVTTFYTFKWYNGGDGYITCIFRNDDDDVQIYLLTPTREMFEDGQLIAAECIQQENQYVHSIWKRIGDD